LGNQLFDGDISDDCRENVIFKLQNAFSDFDYSEFARFVQSPAAIEDGTTSQRPFSTAITSAQAAAVLFPGSFYVAELGENK
jgi:hypothetical protein